MNFNYQKICQGLLKDLPQRQKEVILHRFGLKTGQKETLEVIGRTFGITRERVRQIEEDGLSKLKPKTNQYQKTFQYFENYLRNKGDLRKEDILLEELGSRYWKPQVYFLLSLGNQFQRFGESDQFYSLWTINQNSLNLAKRVINSFYNKLRKINRPISIEEFNPLPEFQTDWRKWMGEGRVASYLEISKIIQKNPEGFFGLKDWPEINPRGIKDKAFLVFKKEGKPLHFREVTNLVGKALPQTVHNELIKDPRFILVGRGIYALKEWGYEPGVVKDIILKVLEKAKRPMRKEEIIGQVLEQRLVKENTILLNLSNKKYFLKTPKGYTVRKI